MIFYFFHKNWLNYYFFCNCFKWFCFILKYFSNFLYIFVEFFKDSFSFYNNLFSFPKLIFSFIFSVFFRCFLLATYHWWMFELPPEELVSGLCRD